MTTSRNLSILAEGVNSSGVLQVSNGGTGLTSITSTQVPYGNGTGSLSISSALTFDGTTLSATKFAGALNGTVGATTPSTGAFTTLSASGTTTLSGGTANGVLYLDGSKAATSGSALTFDGTNLFLGTGYMSFGNNGYIRADSANNKLTFQAGSSGYLWKDGSNSGDWMALTSTGLGIGTSSPSAKLHVYGTYGYFQDGTYNGYFGKGNGVVVGGGTADLGISTSTGAIVFGTGASLTERMRLDSAGNLGLGVTPSAWTFKAFEIGFAGNALWTSATNDVRLSANVNYNSGYKYTNSTSASMYEQSAGIHYWFTAPSGTAGSAISWTQAMTLDASGNLLVGTTNTSATAGVGFKLQTSSSVPQFAIVVTDSGASSNISVYNTNAGAYRFYVDNGGTIHATSSVISAISDQRLKENIRDLDDGLNVIMALKPRKFDWKAGKGKDIKDDRGFIAQEFEQVFPDMIEEWKDAAPEGEKPYKAVNANLIPTLVKAIQELKAELDQLKSQIGK